MANNIIIKNFFYIVIGAIILGIIYINSLDRLETKLRPAFDALCEIYVRNEVSSCIDYAIEVMVDNTSYNASDFYNVKFDENGNVSLIENNSILINKVTNDILYNLGSKLKESEDVKMELRIMDILYPEIFDEVGPMYKMEMRKDGYVSVDYVSDIKEISGNQTSFKAYVQIVVNIRIISPLYSEKFTINRNVLLVDTIISTKNVGLKIN